MKIIKCCNVCRESSPRLMWLNGIGMKPIVSASLITWKETYGKINCTRVEWSRRSPAQATSINILAAPPSRRPSWTMDGVVAPVHADTKVARPWCLRLPTSKSLARRIVHSKPRGQSIKSTSSRTRRIRINWEKTTMFTTRAMTPTGATVRCLTIGIREVGPLRPIIKEIGKCIGCRWASTSASTFTGPRSQIRTYS